MKKILLIFISIFLVSIPLMKTYAQEVSLTITTAPPELPDYEQPDCPADGYIWTPGYWAYDDGYYWVPGVWVMPPTDGYYWTPCYWDYSGGYYAWHEGYWGPTIGFYGGVNYGYGYGGYGYTGGRWDGGHFRYNTAVSHVNVTNVHNTYVDKTVINNGRNHTSFHGAGGITTKPRPEEQAAMKGTHARPTGEQQTHQQTAGKDRNQFASVNHGRPATVAMDKVGGGRFDQHGHTVNTTPVAVAKHPTTTHTRPASTATTHRTTVPHTSTQTRVHTQHTVQPVHTAAQPQQHIRVQQPTHVQQPQQHIQAQPTHMQQPQQQHTEQPHIQAQPHMEPQHQNGGGQPHGAGGGGHRR